MTIVDGRDTKIYPNGLSQGSGLFLSSQQQQYAISDAVSNPANGLKKTHMRVLYSV